MSEFLCKNCNQPMRISCSGIRHYDSPACDKPEFDDDDAGIMRDVCSICGKERGIHHEAIACWNNSASTTFEPLIPPQVATPDGIDLLLSDEDIETLEQA